MLQTGGLKSTLEPTALLHSSGEVLEIRESGRRRPTSGSNRSQHRVISVEFLTAGTYRLTVERGDFQFRAGQCANIGTGGSGLNREYSTYSSEQDPKLAFLIRRVNDGIVSGALSRMRPADVVEIDGAYGDFCIADPSDGRRYVFICTGTGIAPFHSFVTSYPGLDYTIIHGVRDLDERYDRDDYAPGRYIACTSKTTEGDFPGRVTAYLQKHGVDRDAVYYLCGNRNMINEVYDLLRDLHVPGDNLFTETFF